MRRRGDGVPRPRCSGRSTSCSREIDWIAEEHGELQRPSTHFKAEERKGPVECLPHRTVNSVKRRHTWSQQEDDILIKMVNLHCSKNWSTIARAIPGRSPNQCRERWMFYLDPTVNNQPWSEQEDMTLIHAHQVHGNKWCKLAKLFPGRTRKAIKNRWPGLVRRKLKSDLVREQFPCMPNDPLITKKKGSITIKSGQDTSTNNLISTDWPIRPKSEQGLTEDGRNSSSLKGKYSDSIHGKGPVAHLVDVSGKVDGQIARSSFPAVAKEKMNLSSSSVDQKVFYAAARFPRPLENEESTNSLEVAPNSVNTCISPAHDLVSSNDPSNETCRSADPESQELHLANIADLLDMSYCGSLMIVPPDSPNDGNSSHGM